MWFDVQEPEKLSNPPLVIQIHGCVQREALDLLAKAFEKLTCSVLDLDPLNEIPLKARETQRIEEAEDRLEAGEGPAEVLSAIAAVIVPIRQVPALDEEFSICLTPGHLKRMAHEVYDGHIGKDQGREVPVRLEEGMARLDVDSRRVPSDPLGLPVEECLDGRCIAHRVVVDG